MKKVDFNLILAFPFSTLLVLYKYQQVVGYTYPIVRGYTSKLDTANVIGSIIKKREVTRDKHRKIV